MEIREETVQLSPQESNVILARLKPLDVPSLDLRQYEGKKVKIISVQPIEINSKDNPRGKQWVLKVSSEIIAQEKINDKIVDIRGSELFSLIEDTNCQPNGWGKGSKLQKFLDKMGAIAPEALLDKEVMLRLTSRGYLGFII